MILAAFRMVDSMYMPFISTMSIEIIDIININDIASSVPWQRLREGNNNSSFFRNFLRRTLRASGGEVQNFSVRIAEKVRSSLWKTLNVAGSCTAQELQKREPLAI